MCSRSVRDQRLSSFDELCYTSPCLHAGVVQSIAINMSLSVCPPTHISQKARIQTWLNFLCACYLGLWFIPPLNHHSTPQPFYGPFSGTTGVSRCQKRTLDFMVQGKINRGRHADHPDGRTPSGLVTSAHLHHPPYFLQARCPSCRPTNIVKAPKATSAFGLGRRR